MIKNETYRTSLQSTKSLNKLKMDATCKPYQIAPALKVGGEGSVYSITTNIANYSSNKQGNKMEDNYLRRIKYLQQELKKDIMNDNVLRNLFKIKIPGDTTYIDIYLQMRKLQQALKVKQEHEKESKKKLVQMQNALQMQEEQHLRYIEMLGQSIEEKQVQWRSEKHKLQQNAKILQEDSENYNFLLEEIKKKYGSLNQKYKDLSDEFEMQKSAQCLEDLQKKEQYQNLINQYLLELQEYKKQNSALKTQMNQLKLNEESQNTQYEEILDQKQKLQLRIREIEEVNNDNIESSIASKEKYKQNLQQMSIKYEQKLKQIEIKYRNQLKQHIERQSQVESQLSKLKNDYEVMETKMRSEEQFKIKLEKQIMETSNQLKLIEKQIQNIQKKNVKLSIQLMQVRCEKDEQYKAFTKERLQLQNKENIIKNLESKRMTASKNVPDLKMEIQKRYFRL